ncbi:MAG TPA: hypothetical protein VGH20_13385 [Myxococcales bacterium]|jgi:hypothetical protein
MLGPLRGRLPWTWLFLGCVLPDLIDKPLFYGLLWLRGHPDGFISGTRTFGHTGLFLLGLTLLAALFRSRALWAVAAGVLTHLLLDSLGEVFITPPDDAHILIALLFPLYGVRFPVAHFDSLYEHLRIGAQSAYNIAGELLGGAILLRAWMVRRRARRRSASRS